MIVFRVVGNGFLSPFLGRVLQHGRAVPAVKDEEPAGTQALPGFAAEIQERSGAGLVAGDGKHRYHDVGRSGGDECRDIGDHETAGRSGRRFFFRDVDHGGRAVHGGHGIAALGQQQGMAAGAAAQVDDGFWRHAPAGEQALPGRRTRRGNPSRGTGCRTSPHNPKRTRSWRTSVQGRGHLVHLSLAQGQARKAGKSRIDTTPR